MKLLDDEIWGMVPIQFDALLARRREDLREHDYRAGVIAALVANSIPSKTKRPPAKPRDFFPRLRQEQGQ